MPLLRKEPFIREQPPADIKHNDYVFYCKITGEIFTDYEKFFERTILCNSLVWTCAYTGKNGLTFQEALDSERKAKEMLAAFPAKLQRPLLCVALKTHRSRLDDMNQDVYIFAKDRYFIGEEVDAVIGNQKKSGIIIDVQTSSNDGVDPSSYKYVIQEPGQSALYTVEACKVGRRRGTFQRDRCRLFLKKHCFNDVDGIFRVRAKYVKQFKLGDAKFKDVCGGVAPNFPKSVAKKKPKVVEIESDDLLSEEEKSDKKTNEPRKRKHSDKDSSSEDHTSKRSRIEKDDARRMEEARVRAKEKLKQDKEAAKQAKKDELKRKAEEEKEKRKEEKAKLKEEKKRQEEYLRAWNKIRDDLECEDLKDLPKPQAVQCDIPGDAVGDVLCLLEFLTCFKPLFDFDLPSDLSFATLTKALTATDLDGLFFDMLLQLLSAIFRLQEDEEDMEMEDADGKKVLEMVESHNGECRSRRELVRAATVASQWPILNFGMPLSKLPIDSYTVSEVVRLHLMGSGAERTQTTARFDYQQRGGYDASDNPALDLRRHEPEILKALAEHNIFDLSPGDKAKVLCILMNQLLTFATCRDHIDDCCERLRQAQRDLRAHQYAEIKRERDEANFWLRKKMLDGDKVQQDGTAAANGVMDNGCSENNSKNEQKDTKKKNSRKKKSLPTDKDYEMMPSENLDWEKISPEERQHMKEWAVRREKELIEQASELQFSTAICPLGRDRTFRRYWAFRSIPGLFVEDNELYVPDDFFQPVEQKLPPKLSVDSCEVKSNGSNKENAMDTSNNSIVGKDSDDVDNKEVSSLSLSIHEQIESRNSVRWSVYVSPSDVDLLVEALNPRGIRESLLRQIISDQRLQISESIARCDVAAFCGSKVPLDVKPNVSELSQTAERRLEDILRESLLDLEERVFSGTLGTLKVNSREMWRLALSGLKYDPQCVSLTWGGGLSTAVTPLDVKPADVNGCEDGVLTEIKSEQLTSIVHSLAMALLQIEQMLDAKYINPPLGDDEDVKRQKQKALIDAAFRITLHGRHENKSGECNGTENDESADECSVDSEACATNKLSAVERWERSLMSCTSLPQVWLHYSVLESCIVWSRSSLHARCRICRRKGDGEHMLLCDACDRGHHMYCLKPPVKTVPQGDWFCPSCRPKGVVHVPRTPRKSFTEMDSLYDAEDSDASSPEEDTNYNSVDDTEVVIENGDSNSATETEEYADGDDDCDESYSASSSKVQLPQANKKLSAVSRSSTPSVDLKSQRRSQGSARRTQKLAAQTEVPDAGFTRSSGRSRRNQETNGNMSSLSRHSSETGLRRKASAGWSDYEVDSKRLSLTTKSRFSDAELTLKSCEELVSELMHQDDAWPFLKPVTKKEAADYFDIIKNPMDFARIRNKINRFEYNFANEVIDDIRLIFSNCALYNQPESVVAMAGKELENYFERRMQELSLGGGKRKSMSAAIDSSAARSYSSSRKRTL